MKKNTFRAFSIACLGFLPLSVFAQCNDQPCSNLSNILYAAVTDFREYRSMKVSTPDVSTMDTKVPCQMTSWANNVPMYICYAQVPAASADSWYAATIASLRLIQPSWNLEITSPGSDHYVDAGPPDCEIPPTEGPHLGLCPLHLQSAKQLDGTAKIYLWMSSLSSPYLVKRPPGPPPKSTPVTTTTNSCDELCQGLKKAFESRASSFEELRAKNSAGPASDAALKLAGAGNCSVGPVVKLSSRDVGTQFVCYWSESSASSSETRFRDLASRLQILIPSSWSVRQEDQLEELSGSKVTAWVAVSSDAKQEISLFLAKESVGLHIKTWN